MWVEDVSAASIAEGTAQAADPDDSVSYVTADGQTGTYGTFSIDTDGAWSYTLDNSLSATNALDVSETSFDLFTITVQDDQRASTSVVTITGHGSNDAPTITDADAGSVTEDVTAASVVQGDAQAIDPDDSVSYVTADGQTGTYGTFSIDTDGAWSYTLDNSLSATNALDVSETSFDLFTITLQDDQTSSTSVVTITVHGSNDAPTITDADTGSVTEDVTAASVAQSSAQAVDPA